MEQEDEKVLVPVRRFENADEKDCEIELDESPEPAIIQIPLRWRVY